MQDLSLTDSEEANLNPIYSTDFQSPTQLSQFKCSTTKGYNLLVESLVESQCECLPANQNLVALVTYVQ